MRGKKGAGKRIDRRLQTPAMNDAKLSEVLPEELRKLLKDIEMYDGDDALLPWLRCISWIKTCLPANGLTSIYQNLLDLCIKKFSRESQYLTDMRFLQIWIQYADCSHAEAEKVFKQMEALHIGQDSAIFYGAYAIFLEAQGKFLMANNMYQLGLSRQAKPLSILDKGYKEFLKRVDCRHRHRLMKESKPNVNNNIPMDGEKLVARQNLHPIADISSQPFQVVQTPHPLMDLSTNCPRDKLVATSVENKKKGGLSSPCYEVNNFNGKSWPASKFNPWDSETIAKLLRSIKPPLVEYKGFHSSNQNHKGASLMSLKNAPHNKVLELGSRRYHLKGCTGQGAFAQVFKACDEQDRDNIVVLKIQKPPCPWEFYIYSQLDKRVPQEERASFGHARKMHAYEDCSIMICAYGERGTLQDVVNSYLAIGEKMDELLCMYYTVEMLRMLEVMHSVGIIHGDFKPDNLLIHNEGDLLEDWAPDRPGQWKIQGLCLIDWGRSIDLKLFPPGTEFDADCKTSGFRCIEMQQQRPWTYQIDTYGLCCIVHIMLLGSYMEVESKPNSESIQRFQLKTNFKRYHKGKLWGELFTTLLNVKSCQENPSLSKLRGLFESHLMSNLQFPKKIKELMVRQSKIMCSRS